MLKLPVGEERIVPAEDGDFEYRRLCEVGKRLHLNYLEEQNILRKMVEVDRDPEVLPLDHVMHQFVGFVRVVARYIPLRIPSASRSRFRSQLPTNLLY